MSAQKFRKRPVVIEATRFTGENADDVCKWVGSGASHMNRSVFIKTPEGEMAAVPGDWVIKGVAGEFYPCKPHIFEATYEQVIEREIP